MVNFKLRETTDYEKLVPFFITNDLEFSEDEPVPTDIVKCWEIVVDQRRVGEAGPQVNRDIGTSGGDVSKKEVAEDERLIGGFVLAMREGEFIVDGIAIDPEYRKSRLGKALLARGIAETRKAAGERIFLVARAPEFFRKNGFITVPREDAPNFFECLTCPQYGVDCHPEVMRLDL